MITLTNKNKTVVVVLVVLASAGLLRSLNRQANTQKQLDSANIALQLSEKEEGKACGLLTKKEAERFLDGADVVVSSTVVPKDSQFTSVAGKPRVDACSYTAKTSSVVYIDVVTKVYDSPTTASYYFDESRKKIQYGENRAAATSLGIDKLFYSSGVFYAQKGTLVLEVSASKKQATSAIDSEAFSRNVFDYVQTKL
jgi:hypothetical protein